MSIWRPWTIWTNRHDQTAIASVWNGPLRERQPPADEQRAAVKATIGEPADPSVGSERVEIDFVRIFYEDIVELQGTESEEALEQQRQRAHLVAEPARLSDVVVLAQ